MIEDIKKTAETYGTVSEEKVLKESANLKEITETMIEKEIEKKETEEAKIKEEVIEEIEIKEKIKKEKRRGFRNELTREEIVAAWDPKTILGRKVKSGEIKTMDEILEEDRKILEPEIAT